MIENIKEKIIKTIENIILVKNIISDSVKTLVNIALIIIAIFLIFYLIMNYVFFEETRFAAGVFAIWLTRKFINNLPMDSIVVISEILENIIKKDSVKGNIFLLFKENFIEFGKKVKNTGEWIFSERNREGVKSVTKGIFNEENWNFVKLKIRGVIDLVKPTVSVTNFTETDILKEVEKTEK
jgi:hypothetical protein